jgi:hypothetical protein
MKGDIEVRKWAQKTVELLREQLPKNGIPENEVQEFLDHWRDNEKYVFEFQKKRRRMARKHGNDMNGMIRAENKATDILNQYWTRLIRNYLKSLK